MNQKLKIKTLHWDLQYVTVMSLVNTDLARVTTFDKGLFKMFDPLVKDVAQHMNGIKVFFIRPNNSAVGEIFRERLARISLTTRKAPIIGRGKTWTLPELLESLPLLTLLPLLDGEWQK